MAGHRARREAVKASRMASLQRFKQPNLKASIRRRKRSLQNSIEHVAKPKPADQARWKAMAEEIAWLEGKLAERETKAAQAEQQAQEDADHAEQ